MKLSTMMVALVAAVASLAIGDAFVLPSAIPAGLARNAGQAPTSQPAPSRSAGESAVGALNIKVLVGEDENLESALLRFRRTVMRSGHLQELRWKRTFETVAERKKRKRKQNLRKDKIQRSRDRKAKEQQY